MKRNLIARIAISLLMILSLTGCDIWKRSPYIGKYNYVGGTEKASLILRSNGTYEICSNNHPCGGGTYDVGRVDETTDHITFSGRAFADFEYGTPARNAEGQIVKSNEGGSASIEYDGWSCPCVDFEDPDSGIRFQRVSD